MQSLSWAYKLYDQITAPQFEVTRAVMEAPSVNNMVSWYDFMSGVGWIVHRVCRPCLSRCGMFNQAAIVDHVNHCRVTKVGHRERRVMGEIIR